MLVITMNNEMIYIRGVSKTFSNLQVLKNINLKIDRGDFVIIAGENGSGKTTLLKIMTGLLLPDSGIVRVLGVDVLKHWKKISKDIGVALSSERSLYWKLTGLENLEIFGGIYGVKNCKQKAIKILKELNLYHARDKLVEEYSSGMRRKLLLAKAVIHNPKIVFLDEILNGLDPRSYMEIINFLKKLNNDGTTIVLVSHLLHQLPDFCRLIIMKDGSIIYDGNLSELEIKGCLRVKAKIGDVIFDEVISEDDIINVMKYLTNAGAENIQIERDDLYSTIRRLLEYENKRNTFNH